MLSRLAVIVDRDPDTRLIYSTILRHGGFDVLESTDGAEALELIREHKPRVVITEVALRTLDGVELQRCLRAERDTADTRVIFVTADPDPDNKAEAESSGCYQYFLKPCSPHELLDCCEHAAFD